jgi:hypothetical protein
MMFDDKYHLCGSACRDLLSICLQALASTQSDCPGPRQPWTTVAHMGCRTLTHCVFLQCIYNLSGQVKKLSVAGRIFVYSLTTEYHYHCVEAPCWARPPGSSAWEQEAPLNKHQSSQLRPIPPLAGMFIETVLHSLAQPTAVQLYPMHMSYDIDAKHY